MKVMTFQFCFLIKDPTNELYRKSLEVCAKVRFVASFLLMKKVQCELLFVSAYLVVLSLPC